jgi:acyl-CoA synthetase (AMP-forming)/AMP-acid ligase II
MNIADAIETHARQHPGAHAILRGDWTLTYAETDAAVNRVVVELAGRGVLPGQVVGTLLPTLPLHLIVILAIARLGAVLLIIHPNATPERLNAVAARFRLSAIVASRADVDIEVDGCQVIGAERNWLRSPGPGGAPHPATSANAGLPWCIALTSGTTGVPKGVLRTHAEFLDISGRQRPFMKIGPESRFLCRMGMHTMAILARMLNHLHAGGAVVFARDDLDEALEDIDLHRVTHSFVSPAMLGNWLNALPSKRQPFGSLTHLLVGGGGMPEPLRRQVAERITPNLMVSYGTTETWFAALADAETVRLHPGTAGRVLPWIEAQAVDDTDRPLPAGEPGVLRFRGAGVAAGYHGAAEEPMAMSKAFRNGWCYVGDIGRVTADRLLYVDERVDDVINVGGPKINASAIEKLLLTHPDVADVAAVGMTEHGGRQWLAAAVVARGEFDARRLLQHYLAHGGQYASLIRFIPVRRLPRNAMGKVVKHELVQWITRRMSTQASPQSSDDTESGRA